MMMSCSKKNLLCESFFGWPGGVVVVLGPTGRNFAAGMSGGLAFVLDESATFASRCNSELVDLIAMTPETNPDFESDEKLVLEMIQAHVKTTNSSHAAKILAEWETVYRAKMVKVNIFKRNVWHSFVNQNSILMPFIVHPGVPSRLPSRAGGASCAAGQGSGSQGGSAAAISRHHFRGVRVSRVQDRGRC